MGVHCRSTSWPAVALEIESRCLRLESAPAGSISSCSPPSREHMLTNLTVIVPRIIRPRTYVRREDGNYFRVAVPTLRGFRLSRNQFCKGLARHLSAEGKVQRGVLVAPTLASCLRCLALCSCCNRTGKRQRPPWHAWDWEPGTWTWFYIMFPAVWDLSAPWQDTPHSSQPKC